ncbi:MAG: iron ABC transporter permease [Alphaproteobacteria bacterium]|nr:iron ABC transporter permease [Alphaproteobacteria bacterium]
MAALSGTAPAWTATPRFQLLLGVAVLALVALLTAAPVFVVVVGALDANVWHETFAESRTNRSALAYSFLLALRAPIAAVLGFLIAWLLIRFRLPGGRFIEFAMWVTFFIPILPVTLSWILLMSPRYGLINQALQNLPFIDAPVFDIYSIGGILWVHVIAASVPVMVLLLGPAIRQLDASFEEVGRVCGSSPFQVFRRITLPILAPAILTGTLAGFIKSLEAFEVEQLLGRPADIYVYSTRIYDLASWEPPNFKGATALSTFVLTCLLLIAIVYQRLSRRTAHATILGRGASFAALQIGRVRWTISGILMLVVAIALVVPLAMLVVGSCMKLFGFFTIAAPYTLEHWRTVLADPTFMRSLVNSLVLSAGAGFGGVLLYAVIAYLIVRSRLPGRMLIDLLAWLPWSIPGILLGISVLWLILASPLLSFLYGSLFSLMLIMIIAQMPIGVHMMKTAIGQIGIELEHSSRMCGAGATRTFFAIVLPLIRPMLVSIFVIVFISAIRDISTIIFLASAKNQTLSLLMMQFSMASNLEASSVVGVVTTAIVVVVALAARRYGLDVMMQR